MARLDETDDGIGIAAADVPRIFERFEGAVPTESYGDLGLGLYLTRNIVRAHGGEIRVDSTRGKGSTFIISLPLAAPAPAAT